MEVAQRLLREAACEGPGPKPFDRPGRTPFLESFPSTSCWATFTFSSSGRPYRRIALSPTRPVAVSPCRRVALPRHRAA
jgi:hypothetical protein